jgi:hypothetical protein
VLLRRAGELIIRENWGTAEQNLGKREEHEWGPSTRGFIEKQMLGLLKKVKVRVRDRNNISCSLYTYSRIWPFCIYHQTYCSSETCLLQPRRSLRERISRSVQKKLRKRRVEPQYLLRLHAIYVRVSTGARIHLRLRLSTFSYFYKWIDTEGEIEHKSLWQRFTRRWRIPLYAHLKLLSWKAAEYGNDMLYIMQLMQDDTRYRYLYLLGSTLQWFPISLQEGKWRFMSCFSFFLNRFQNIYVYVPKRYIH